MLVRGMYDNYVGTMWKKKRQHRELLKDLHKFKSLPKETEHK